mgnify:CR=1 FL=1
MATEQHQSVQRAAGGTPVALTIDRQTAGQRLDHYLVLALPQLSRSRLSLAIKHHHILVNGKPSKASRKLHSADSIEGCVPEAEELHVGPQKIAFDIVFEDDSIMLISKPPDLVVHPATGNADGTLVNGLLHHCRSLGDVGDSLRPGIVHRLDKDTSGIMVVAKTPEMHRLLVDIFKAREVAKKYHALVHGVMPQSSGRIVAPIGRHPVNRQKMAIRESGGKHAATSWVVEKVYAGRFSLLEITIETGRTHQIRVHMASLGHPVAGDEIYGSVKGQVQFPRQMLHASSLGFRHPLTGKKMLFSTPLWQDMHDILEKMRDREDND